MIGKMGWRPDPPDNRDYHMMSPEVSKLISPALEKYAPIPEPRPTKMDLLKWSPPIDTQDAQDCIASAGTGLMEFFNRKAGIYYGDFSRRFLYKITRNIMGLIGDTGATLRDTMRAMAKYGVPPEFAWSYDHAIDEDPSLATYDLARNHQALVYYRLDPYGQPTSRTVTQTIRFLAAGFPFMLGFAVPSSIPEIGDGRCDVPFFQSGDKILGYHAVMINGYDDNRVIGPYRGAYLFPNS